jgi:hypothetical protein
MPNRKRRAAPRSMPSVAPGTLVTLSAGQYEVRVHNVGGTPHVTLTWVGPSQDDDRPRLRVVP